MTENGESRKTKSDETHRLQLGMIEEYNKILASKLTEINDIIINPIENIKQSVNNPLNALERNILSKKALSTSKTVAKKEKFKFPKNFKELYLFYEEQNYLAKPERIKSFSKGLVLYRCERNNPITKNKILDEQIILININSKSDSLVINQEIIEQILKKPDYYQLMFVDYTNRRMLKTTTEFLFLLVLEGERFAKTGRSQTKSVIKIIRNFKKRYRREEFELQLKFDHHKLMPRFFSLMLNSTPSFVLRKEILEFWEFKLKWIKRYMHRGYAAEDVLKLVKQKRQKDRLKGKSLSSSDSLQRKVLDPDLVLNVDEHVVDVESLDRLDSVITDLNGKMDAITNSVDDETSQIDLSTLDAADEIIDNMEATMYGPKPLFSVEGLKESHKAIQEFLIFQESTDDLDLQILDINGGVYELQFYDENSEGEALLIDVDKLDSPKRVPFGINTIRNFFDIEGANDFRIFFADVSQKRIMQVTKMFIFEYMSRWDPEENIDKIDALLDINRQIDLIRIFHKIPMIGRLDVFFSALDLVINHTTSYPFMESILDEIIGIWEYKKDDDAYEQVFPESGDEDLDEFDEIDGDLDADEKKEKKEGG